MLWRKKLARRNVHAGSRASLSVLDCASGGVTQPRTRCKGEIRTWAASPSMWERYWSRTEQLQVSSKLTTET